MWLTKGTWYLPHGWTQLQLTKLLAQRPDQTHRNTCQHLPKPVMTHSLSAKQLNAEANKEITGICWLCCNQLDSSRGQRQENTLLKDFWMSTALLRLGFFFSQFPCVSPSACLCVCQRGREGVRKKFSPCMGVRKDNSIQLYIWEFL